MNLKINKTDIEIHYKGLIVEVYPKAKLCVVFKPGKVMGEKLVSFTYSNMTLTELFNKIDNETEYS